jgi:hypothetical protein
MWWRSVRASAELALNLVGQNLHWTGAWRCLGNTGPMSVKYALHESERRPPMLCVFLLLLALLVAPSVFALPGRLSTISTSPVSDGGPACCCSIAAAERRQHARRQQVARRRLCRLLGWVVVLWGGKHAKSMPQHTLPFPASLHSQTTPRTGVCYFSSRCEEMCELCGLRGAKGVSRNSQRNSAEPRMAQKGLMRGAP